MATCVGDRLIALAADEACDAVLKGQRDLMCHDEPQKWYTSTTWWMKSFLRITVFRRMSGLGPE